MQPYTNPNYFNQYPQYQPQYAGMQGNPYMDRINSLQQYQQSLQPQQIQSQNTLGGKVVDSLDAVKATDIPMDGNLYYFPKADGTEIYAKRWQQDGTTRILTFKPTLDNDMSISSKNDENSKFEPFNEFAEAFMKRFDDIDSRFDKLEKSIGGKTTSRAKKEVDSE
ncbi:MAG: hypothetical protein LUI12_02035 [Clostridiales bacterium]|nr:hypothetical protein [Clostridiales bacterium]